MAGSFISQSTFDDPTASTGGNGGTTLTVLAADTLIALVTYTAGDATVTLNSDWGSWTEDTSIQLLTGNRWRAYYIASATAATVAPSLTLSDSRDTVGLYVVQLRGLSTLIDAVVNGQNGPGTGDILTSGNVNFTSQPAMAIGFCWDLDGGGTPPALITGTTYTSRGTGWNMADGTGNIRCATKAISATGNDDVDFNSAFGSHNYRTTLFGFTEASGSVGGRLTGKLVSGNFVRAI